MLKPRYFYSEPYSLVNVNYVTDGEGYMVDVKGDASFKKNFPRITVCGVWNTDTNIMSFGIATCSENDLFVKKTGRELSYERAINDPVKSIDLEEGDNVSELFISVAREFENEHKKKIFGYL